MASPNAVFVFPFVRPGRGPGLAHSIARAFAENRDQSPYRLASKSRNESDRARERERETSRSFSLFLSRKYREHISTYIRAFSIVNRVSESTSSLVLPSPNSPGEFCVESRRYVNALSGLMASRVAGKSRIVVVGFFRSAVVYATPAVLRNIYQV